MGMEPHCCLVSGVIFQLGVMVMIRFHYRGYRTLRAVLVDFLCFLAILGSLAWTWYAFSYPMK
jgi:hypothetical protein